MSVYWIACMKARKVFFRLGPGRNTTKFSLLTCIATYILSTLCARCCFFFLLSRNILSHLKQEVANNIILFSFSSPRTEFANS